MATEMSPSEDGYQARVAKAYDAVHQRALRRRAEGLRVTLDAVTDRYIFFSDLHRGARNRADDFRPTERALDAALAYYNRLGYTLVLIGDVEELWEERPAAVLKAYPRSYALEAPFHKAGRYIRIWGNHDDEWQYPARVHTFLDPVYGAPALRVHESLLIDVVDGDRPLGLLFVVHGHQGDAPSDRWSWLSRLVIRYLWRPFQRLTGASTNTPATSWDLSHELNRAIYAWAARQSGVVLIAGHTHRPVFRSLSHAEQIAEELARLELIADDPPTPAQLEAQALLLAKLEWLRTDEPSAATRTAATRTGSADEYGHRLAKPCYFNAGCCCYEDGDITGLEIAGGEIRLIRWPNEAGDAEPHVLARDSLRDVLAAC
jgi:UDP-2,3-diacylglucosamine pyrophosphatase LpxH